MTLYFIYIFNDDLVCGDDEDAVGAGVAVEEGSEGPRHARGQHHVHVQRGRVVGQAARPRHVAEQVLGVVVTCVDM